MKEQNFSLWTNMSDMSLTAYLEYLKESGYKIISITPTIYDINPHSNIESDKAMFQQLIEAIILTEK